MKIFELCAFLRKKRSFEKVYNILIVFLSYDKDGTVDSAEFLRYKPDLGRWISFTDYYYFLLIVVRAENSFPLSFGDSILSLN